MKDNLIMLDRCFKTLVAMPFALIAITLQLVTDLVWRLTDFILPEETIEGD